MLPWASPFQGSWATAFSRIPPGILPHASPIRTGNPPKPTGVSEYRSAITRPSPRATRGAAEDKVTLLGFLRRYAPERLSAKTSGVLDSPLAASDITADRPAIFGSPLGLPGSLGIACGAEQATVTDRLVYCSFNLVGRACAFLSYIEWAPPLAQLSSAARCRWYRVKRRRYFPGLLPIGKWSKPISLIILSPVGFSPRFFPCSQRGFRRCCFIPFKEPHRCRAAPRKEVFRALPGPVFPRNFMPFARPVPFGSGPFWRGGLARARGFVLVCAVATISLWGNCVGGRIETLRAPHSARARFLIAPCRTAPKSYH
jgi:hypothetical protein